MLGERGQDRQRAFAALAEAEQASELLADQIGRIAADRGGGAGRERGQAQRVVRLPHPVGRGAQEIGLALDGWRGGGLPGLATSPAGDGERDLVAVRLGADPKIDVMLPIGGDGGAADRDAETTREPGQRGELRHGEHSARIPAGLGVKSGQRRIGGDQPAFGVDSALHGDRVAHAASEAGRARVEMRATAER